MPTPACGKEQGKCRHEDGFQALVGRVLLGEPQLVNDSKRQIRKPDGDFDSIIAYSKLRADTTFYYSEFVVYHNSQAYPEYLVTFERREGKRKETNR